MQKRGLIVDDEPAVCEMVGRVLTSAGMEALTLTKSADAPGLLSGGKFDVVFLDLHMAAPDGIELARQMRGSRWNRATPIVLISDDQRPSAMSVGFEAGASFLGLSAEADSGHPGMCGTRKTPHPPHSHSIQGAPEIPFG